MKNLAAFLLLPAALCGQIPSQARIGNRHLERTFAIRDGRVRTVSLLNKLDGRLYAMDSDEFELEFVWERLEYLHGEENPVRLTSRDFVVRDVARPTPSGGEQQLAFLLQNERFGLEARIVLTLGPDDWFLRKRLEIRSPRRDVVFLSSVALERLRLRGADPRLGGFGQPLYADNLFFGVEYPASYNVAENGAIRCYYYLGETTGGEWLRTESAVLGVAADGAVRRAFLDYVSRIRSGKVRFTSVFNTWYDMQGDALTEEDSRERMATLKQKLLDPYGLRLDSFVLDDGWDDVGRLWQIHPRRFHGDFDPFRRALEAGGSRLGLWFGPVGGYEPVRLERLAAGRRDGYEITANGKYFCLAGARYREKFKQTVLEMVRKYRVNHLKFDGVPYGCNAPGHGHLPGIYSREAELRAFIDVLQSVRAADPEVFLNITTGNWLSPWWLQYADVVFMGGLDYGFLNDVPAVSEREKAITYRDKVLYDDFRTYEYQFPQSSIMTIGIIKGTLGGEGGLGETLESFTNNVVMNFSRGSMLTELYLSPSVLTDAEWRALGGLMKWARDSSDVLLTDTRSILGDPSRREVYGYAHFAGKRGIVTVRNPSIEPKSVSVPLDRSAGLEPTATRFRAQVIFPYQELLAGSFAYGDSLPLRVQGYQVLVAELAPEGSEVAGAAAGLRYDAGGTYDPASSGADRVRVEALEFRPGGGSFTVAVPDGARNVRLALLCQPEDEKARLSAKLKANGTELGFSAVSALSTEKGLGAGEGRWTFLVAPLAAAKNRVSFDIVDAGAPFTGELSVWLLADFLLRKTDQHTASSTAARTVLPISSGGEYRTIALFQRRF